jgi:hypothetical protein
MLRQSLFAVLLLLLFASASFAQTPLVGTWPSGSWHADDSRHHGPLHATFTSINDSQVQAHFGGRFAKVIPFRYNVVLNVTGTDGTNTYLTGSSHLPIFGTFHYNAVATPTTFEAHYSHRRYTGVFLLQR